MAVVHLPSGASYDYTAPNYQAQDNNNIVNERFASHVQNSSEYALSHNSTPVSAGRSLSDVVNEFKQGLNNPVVPSSGYDTSGMYSLYDPNWNGGSSASFVTDPDEREKLIQSLAPYSSLFGMDVETQYQEALSGSAHQREVADLRAAGLNPVLSANGGNGASVFNGTYAPILSSGSSGSAGFSAGSGRDGSTIGDKLKDLNWRGAASSIGYAIGSALTGRTASAVGNAVSAAFKLFT